ncbi:hypothetical protein Mnod_4184 [Methylobacterium nodulans ORS 2060]|uniref:Uncharacterized protein n=1 Tax=Methylobacterium nodulans (strain LMG 21967 / CNCM I-2342 / ORS 2060) TaxID=460265 RepID=B8IV03_METNO|nr:hypothetical protein Mnod_4184 [Methylobacterium nodulans ORS 2060]
MDATCRPMVELQYAAAVSHGPVRQALKKPRSNRI